MLCTDHVRFLEIADVIHRLQLIILKGVMEKTSDNSWARFIVEVLLTYMLRLNRNNLIDDGSMQGKQVH